ncbi:MAG: sulfatase-like hydrolase/transferase [Bacteroidota bacterium]
MSIVFQSKMSKFKTYLAALKKASGFLLILIINFQCVQKPESTEPPNIVWIVMEDMSPQFYGAYGNEAAKTPVIDSLINAGTRFDAAFSTGAVCSPSRYTIITGTRTNEYGTGHHRSNFPIPDSVIPFPKYLQDSGYHTSNNAKRDYSTSARWRITQEAWVESSAEAGWWNRKGDQPFFSVFNFNNCHQSRTFTNPYDNYKERILDKLSPEEIIADEDIILPDFYKDTPELRKELARTYNSLIKTDHEIDTLMDRLRKENLVESTIIFIYSDHGGGSLRTKTKGTALGHQIPMAVIFPEQYEYLNPFKNKAATNQPITFEDLGPTVLALAGIEKPDYMTGKPFLGKKSEAQQYAFCSADRGGEATDLVRSVSDGEYFYTRAFMPEKPQYSYFKYFDYSQSRQLIRQYEKVGNLNKTQRIPFEAQPKEMLYDLKNDLWQTSNLAGQPEYQATLTKLRKALNDKLTALKDVHFVPEYLLDSIAKRTTPFEYKESEVYDFDSIYPVAKLANEGSQAIAEQINALKSDDPTIRYWATLGICAQQQENLVKYQNVLEGLLEDKFPPVQILAASTLYEYFDSEDGLTVLREYLYDPNEHLAIQSAQEILYFTPEKSKPFLQDVRALKSQKIPGGLSESLDMYLYLFEGEDLYYQTHW